MSASIKEALAALDAAESSLGQLGWFNVIRDGLEAAAQEAEAWEEIEAWREHGTQTAAVVIGLLHEDKAMPMSFVSVDQESFRATLTKAAAWCRAELAK